MAPHQIRFPNEDASYRQARDRLLGEEVALRAQIEKVAALRRTLPMGGRVSEDYVFESAHGPAPLSSLFEQGKDSLIVYSYMFTDADERPCPMCTSYLDGANGDAPHIMQRTSFVVVAQCSIDRLQAHGESRGWENLVLLSAANNSFATDYHTQAPDGRQLPLVNVFVRRDGEIRHFWSSELFFAESDWHPRHNDLMWPLWAYFDLTPEGRGDWFPPYLEATP